jgi:hypothetical protein
VAIGSDLPTEAGAGLSRTDALESGSWVHLLEDEDMPLPFLEANETVGAQYLQ